MRDSNAASGIIDTSTHENLRCVPPKKVSAGVSAQLIAIQWSKEEKVWPQECARWSTVTTQSSTE